MALTMDFDAGSVGSDSDSEPEYAFADSPFHNVRVVPHSHGQPVYHHRHNNNSSSSSSSSRRQEHSALLGQHRRPVYDETMLRSNGNGHTHACCCCCCCRSKQQQQPMQRPRSRCCRLVCGCYACFCPCLIRNTCCQNLASIVVGGVLGVAVFWGTTCALYAISVSAWASAIFGCSLLAISCTVAIRAANPFRCAGRRLILILTVLGIFGGLSQPPDGLCCCCCCCCCHAHVCVADAVRNTCSMSIDIGIGIGIGIDFDIGFTGM